MPFDIQMPDGTVIQGVPDGTTKAQIEAKYQAHTATPSSTIEPEQNGAKEPQGIGAEISSYLGGLNNGLYAIPQGALRMGARGVDAAGLADNLGIPGGNATKMVGDILGDHQPKDKFQKGGDFVGSAIGTLPLMGMGPIAGGAATGAVLSEAPDLKGAALDTGIGAAGGKLGDLLMRGVSRVVSPMTSKYAKALMGENVRLTPGQILGGVAQRTEDKMASVPFVGDMIANARIRGLEDFNRAAINRSIEPIGSSLPDGLSGRGAVDFAHKQLSNNYNRILGQAKFTADPTFMQDVVSLVSSAKMIPEYGDKPISDFMQTNVAPRLSGGAMTGRDFKEIDEMLGQEVRDYTGGGPNDRKMARAFEALQGHFKDALGRTNPTLRPDLDATDTGFANLVRIENAAGRNGGPKGVDPGVFSPAQLSAAVRDTDVSARKNAAARGTALMQDLSDAGNAVLPQQVPDSGTPGRIAAMLLASGTVGNMVTPAAAPVMGAMTAAYTKPGIKALEYALARRPQSAQALGKALRQSSPYAGQASAALLGPMLIGGQQ